MLIRNEKRNVKKVSVVYGGILLEQHWLFCLVGDENGNNAERQKSSLFSVTQKYSKIGIGIR